VLLLTAATVVAQDSDQPGPLESAEPPSLDVEEPSDGNTKGTRGYGDEGRRIGTPVDVERDLDFSFPKRDYILPRIIPKKYFKWKEDLYEQYGVKLGFSYQAIYQRASDTTRFYGFDGEKDVAAGWALIEGKWEVYNRGKDFEGSLVAALDWRHNFTDGRPPAIWGITDVGSLWPTDVSYIDWDPWVPVAFWEQWLTKDRFVLRLGQQNVSGIYDFFRFKDTRVAFSSGPFTTGATTIPVPGPGLGAAFKFWPMQDSTLYVVGTVNDVNFEVGRWTWDTAIKEADFFYGLEVGYNWARSKGNYDHLHVNLFYADALARDPIPILPDANEAGWGFKILGEKQYGQFVAFGSYTYNTARGGPFPFTYARNSATAGLALLKPFGMRGEIEFGAIWAQPFNKNLRDQYGLEAYWKILLTPSLWVTPGVQVLFDPSFNPEADIIGIYQIKARLFF
jgi:hypothetical protein